MERNYNIHYMKPNSYASFSLVQAKHEDHERDEKEILINKKKKQKKGSHNIGNGKREVKLSTDPQSVAARERRHRISERFKILQGLVPGGTKMDTVSMLDEAIQYVKFLKAQIWLHQAMLSFNHLDHVPCHDDDGHHILASSEQQSLSSQENDHHLNMADQMYHDDHHCFYVEGEETMHVF